MKSQREPTFAARNRAAATVGKEQVGGPDSRSRSREFSKLMMAFLHIGTQRPRFVPRHTQALWVADEMLQACGKCRTRRVRPELLSGRLFPAIQLLPES